MKFSNGSNPVADLRRGAPPSDVKIFKLLGFDAKGNPIKGKKVNKKER